MTKQETFDIVARHLLTQGAQSEHRASETCMLRGDDGRMCAAGVLIPDHLYNEIYEHQYVRNSELGTLIAQLGHDIGLVQDLQNVHDDYRPHDWRARLVTVANQHLLSDKVVHEV